MKNYLLLTLFICATFCYGQNPDTNLFQKWYLRSLQLSDGATRFSISEANNSIPPGLTLPTVHIPAIEPTLTITPDMQITGVGACNSFTGALTISNGNQLGLTSVTPTLAICTPPDHNSLENNYFQLFQLGGQLQITPVQGGLALSIYTRIFGQAVFYNFKSNLNSQAFSDEIPSLFPNPSNSKISVQSKSPIEKVEIYNLLGQNYKSVYNNFESIDISDLKKGTYILKIYDKNGTSTKKMIKE